MKISNKNGYRLMIVLVACMGARAQDTVTNSYLQTNLVSDVTGKAPKTDAHLVNPWGLSRGASTDWWVADAGTGVSTVYSGTGAIETLVVTIPPASGTGPGSPTGTVALGSDFVFVTLDGTISEWTGGTTAVIKVNNSSKGAAYTGCTLASNNSVTTLYVANAAGGVEAYTTSFKPVTLMPGAFVDSNVPAGYAPYGIQSAGGKIWVTFTAAPGAGNGYVDAFDPAGNLLLSLVHGMYMNQPWGIALAPANFGAFGKMLLVGNTGSGEIAAFNPTTGTFEGFLKNSAGKAITNSGLWAIFFGSGGASGPTTTLYFTAGIDNYLKGLFGTITAN
jgi:uncharacterized protein (TIGR03118 family)